MSDPPVFNCPSECLTLIDEGLPTEHYEYDVECLTYCLYQQMVLVGTKIDAVGTTCASILALLNRVFVAPHASALISEYLSNEDLDGNGLVYGYDFYISDPPLMIKNMNIPKRGTSMTWANYLASVA
jgi:hypothetical protein